MQRPRALLFFVAGLVWMAIPLIAAAQLVPCGTDATGGALSCDLCSLGRLMQNIINYLILYVSIPLAAAMFAYAGFLYVTGAANPTQISKAHSIFKRVLIGFLIAISAWLVVQTILNAVFDKDGFFDSGGDWFTLSCVSDLGPDAGQRLTDKNFGDLINEIIPQAPPPPSSIFVSTIDNTPYQVTCAPGTGTLLPDQGLCFDGKDYSQPTSIVSTGSGTIAGAAATYFGQSTAAGPDGGNLACAWAVNNVLQSAGISPVDGNSVQSMENVLTSGRGTPVNQSAALAGDIVIQGDDKHVGICQNNGCTQVISNSSSNASFTNVSDVNFSNSYPNGTESRIYRVN